ncbi:MAG: ComF family protein [Pirellulales bacterium]|nr:ComF family protein [Pirellulales bacterium]
MVDIKTTWLSKFKNSALDLLFPPSCVVCHVELEKSENGKCFCPECLNQLPLVTWPVCRRCAARVPDIPGTVDCCSRCVEENLAFDRAFALGSYEGLLRDLVLRMKKDRREILAVSLGRLILDRLGEHLKSLSLDTIVPVPMPVWRRLARGANPPEAVAEVLSPLLGVPAFTRLLKKRPNASPQLGLTRAGRFQNIRGQMRVRAGYYLEAPHVLLIDDILTSGATCSEAARILKRRGAEQVTVLVVGRTPHT